MDFRQVVQVVDPLRLFEEGALVARFRFAEAISVRPVLTAVKAFGKCG